MLFCIKLFRSLFGKESNSPAAARPTGPNERPQKAERLLNSKKTYRKSQEANPLLELVKEQPPADIMAEGG